MLMSLLCILMPALTAARVPTADPLPREEIVLDWMNSEGKVWQMRALIGRPERGVDRGRAVFFFSGGLTTDLDWTVPGRLEHNGRKMQLTIGGNDTRDGQTLAAALVQDGWTVIRYSSIREDDPLHAQSRAMAEAMPYEATADLARFMWVELRRRAAMEGRDVVVLGHSLGAARGAQVAAEEAAGFVFLAGAYLSPTKASPRRLSVEALVGVNASENEVVPRRRAEDASENVARRFDQIDRDGSGTLSGWELAADRAISAGRKGDAEMFNTAAKLPWPSDALAKARRPTLAIWGGLDPISYHGPLLERLADRDGFPLTTRYFPALGHNLGAMEAERAGPIDPAVVAAIVEWLARTFPREPPAPVAPR